MLCTYTCFRNGLRVPNKVCLRCKQPGHVTSKCPVMKAPSSASARMSDGVYTQEDIDRMYTQMSASNCTGGMKRRLQLTLAKALAYLAANPDVDEERDGGGGGGGGGKYSKVNAVPQNVVCNYR